MPKSKTWGMTERAREFFRELFAPFPDEAYYEKPNRTRAPETYLDARWIMWRLDSVCGPTGWKVEFSDALGGRGLQCTISICCPVSTGNEGETAWVWIAKSDGAGPEDMGHKGRDGERVSDEDNSSKAAFTNSFRRCASNVWGFGRNLYRDRATGKSVPMPTWVQDLWDGGGEPDEEDEPPARRRARDDEDRDRPDRREKPVSRSAPPEARQRKVRLPHPTGDDAGTKEVYKWFKRVEEHFNVPLLDRAADYAKKKRYSPRTDQWSPEELEEIVAKCVDYLRDLDVYNGECELEDEDDFGGPPPPPRRREDRDESRDQARRRVDEAIDESAAAEASSIKKAIKAAVVTVLKTTAGGRDPSDAEILAAIGELSAVSKDRHGVTGEVMELSTWKSCTDTAWLKNILRKANDQIARTAAAEADADPADDDPFS